MKDNISADNLISYVTQPIRNLTTILYSKSLKRTSISIAIPQKVEKLRRWNLMLQAMSYRHNSTGPTYMSRFDKLIDDGIIHT